MMRNARVTILMDPEKKKDIEARAAFMGVSSGEYIRLAVDNFEKITPEQEAELIALTAQVNAAVPRMMASLDRMSETLRKSHEEMDAFLREKGIRK